MAEITRVKETRMAILKLRQVISATGEPPEVVVGFTQSYALIVHEVHANHVVGQWKYLSTAARDNMKVLGEVARNAMKRGATLVQAIFMAGLRLQAEAQELTPIDTSALRASAFTALVRDVESVSKAARAESDAIRDAGRRSK